jgi:hypothetical protein
MGMAEFVGEREKSVFYTELESRGLPKPWGPSCGSWKKQTDTNWKGTGVKGGQLPEYEHACYDYLGK